jgi:DNA-directed RNA polymerase subunit RPC12/RpoP
MKNKDTTDTLVCPVCRNSRFVVKYEASHVYSYVVDSDAPGCRNTDEFLSFLYDRRELINSNQYVECQACGTKFPCSFTVWNKDTSREALQEALNKLY